MKAYKQTLWKFLCLDDPKMPVFSIDHRDLGICLATRTSDRQMWSSDLRVDLIILQYSQGAFQLFQLSVTHI